MEKVQSKLPGVEILLGRSLMRPPVLSGPSSGPHGPGSTRAITTHHWWVTRPLNLQRCSKSKKWCILVGSGSPNAVSTLDQHLGFHLAGDYSAQGPPITNIFTFVNIILMIHQQLLVLIPPHDCRNICKKSVGKVMIWTQEKNEHIFVQFWISYH